MEISVFGSELLFTEALSSLLVRRGHVVQCPSSERELVGAAESNGSRAYLVDVSSAGDIGAIAGIKRVTPHSPVVTLTAESDLSLLWRAIDAGADGVCLKSDGIEEIERAFARAERRVSGKDRAAPAWSNGASALVRRRSLQPSGTLITPREQAVLELLILGASTTKISVALSMSEATVRTHLQHLFAKFGVHSRVALIAAAVQSGRRQGDPVLVQ
ncbi:MAG: DNA-binding response regulator [Acidimicrobiaceae bacterium]|nr:DNA-binding response regulator [Acidimicrobiaceae bacterium]